MYNASGGYLINKKPEGFQNLTRTVILFQIINVLIILACLNLRK